MQGSWSWKNSKRHNAKHQHFLRLGVDGNLIIRTDEARLSFDGTFKTAERKARTGRNPRTGKPVTTVAKKVPTFTPGNALKNAVNV